MILNGKLIAPAPRVSAGALLVVGSLPGATL